MSGHDLNMDGVGDLIYANAAEEGAASDDGAVHVVYNPVPSDALDIALTDSTALIVGDLDD